MTNQEKIAFIREKCIEINPDKKWHDSADFDAQEWDNPVDLQDVLLAIPKTGFETWCSAYFLYMRYTSGKSHPYYKMQGAWDLKKTLEYQDEPTISFIYDVLV